ncbi:MAG TPA: glycoside hydrolase family protein [Noviherbaspirillum sp.]|nr:glycoside hydrolase family protein [Noviherbaspirillum sp.]
MDEQILKAELIRDEGKRNRLYRDTVGKLTGGVGRNFDDVPLSDDEIDLMLSNDIKRACADLDRKLPWWRKLDPVRQRVLVNMAFNMGIGDADKGSGLLGFKNTLAMVQAGDYRGAAKGMRSSKWAKQVGPRAERLATLMETA